MSYKAKKTKERTAADRLPSPAICERCGGDFLKTRPWHRFCSPDCRHRTWMEKHIAPQRLSEFEHRIAAQEKRIADLEQKLNQNVGQPTSKE